MLQKLKKCNNRLISTTGRNMYTWIFYHMAIYTCPSCVQLKSSWNENNPNCDEIKLFLSNSTVVTHKLLNSYADISWPFKTIIWSMHFFFMSKLDWIFGNISFLAVYTPIHLNFQVVCSTYLFQYCLYSIFFLLCKYKINLCYHKISPHFLWIGDLEKWSPTIQNCMSDSASVITTMQ